uniref:Uncharacterized protein n=1 Tax=viral metagenome TaxID=1070528 RepID=A0A6C0HJ61_9ZZZZ
MYYYKNFHFKKLWIDLASEIQNSFLFGNLLRIGSCSEKLK